METTIAQLIEILLKYDSNYKVKVFNENSNSCNITGIIEYERDSEIHFYITEK